MAAPKGHPNYAQPDRGNGMGGRPVEWTPDCIEDIRYKLEEWMKIPTNLWFDDFVIEHDLPADIVARLANKSESFLATYKRAVMIQQARMFKGAVFNKDMNSTALIFGLKANHGWCEGKDRMSVEHKSTPRSQEDIAIIKQAANDHKNSLEQASDQPS